MGSRLAQRAQRRQPVALDMCALDGQSANSVQRVIVPYGDQSMVQHEGLSIQNTQSIKEPMLGPTQCNVGAYVNAGAAQSGTAHHLNGRMESNGAQQPAPTDELIGSFGC